MKTFYCALALLLLCAVTIASGQSGDRYCPLNPANGECGGVDDASGHGKKPDSLFYCDMSAANMDIATQADGACRFFSEELDSRYPVVVASTGDGRPIVFFASSAGGSGGRDVETLYVICDTDDCSQTSVPLQLEGFNAQFALDFTHVEVDGKRLLTVVGVGSQTAADIGFGSDGYPVRYAHCIDDECSGFASTSLGSVLETAGDTKNVQRLVSLTKLPTESGDRLAMLYFPGRGRAGFTHQWNNPFPGDVTDLDEFEPSDGLVVAGEPKEVQTGVYNGDQQNLDFSSIPTFPDKRDVHTNNKRDAHTQQAKAPHGGNADSVSENDPVGAASLNNDAFYQGDMFEREYAVLATCADPPRCTQITHSRVDAQSSRVISPYRAARPWTRDSAWQPFDYNAGLNRVFNMVDYDNRPSNQWTSPHERLWDDPFVSKVHAAVPHLVGTEQGLWVGFQINHYQALSDIDDGITQVGRLAVTNTTVTDTNVDEDVRVSAVQYRALHMCLDVQLVSAQRLQYQDPVQGFTSDSSDPADIFNEFFTNQRATLRDEDTPLSTLLQRHEATPWPNTASLKWVSCGTNGEHCATPSGAYMTRRDHRFYGGYIEKSTLGTGSTFGGGAPVDTPLWATSSASQAENPAEQHFENARERSAKRGDTNDVIGFLNGLSTGDVLSGSNGLFVESNHGYIAPAGVEVPDPNMGWRFQARRRTGAGASALQTLPFDATQLTLTHVNRPNVDPLHVYGAQVSEAVNEEGTEIEDFEKRSDEQQLNDDEQEEEQRAERGSSTGPSVGYPFGTYSQPVLNYASASYADFEQRSCVDLLTRLSGANGEDGVQLHRYLSGLHNVEPVNAIERGASAGSPRPPHQPWMPSGYQGIQISPPHVQARQHAAWLSGLHSGETVPSVFATGAAGNGFPASVGVVTAESGEPSASGWAIVLSVCATPSCDQQIHRYLMDSSTLHDNWGMLDDPLSTQNEILNHPDGSWTIVIFVRPHGEGSTRERKQAADGRSHSTLYREGSSGKPLFINCLDETCSEASISTLAPNRLQSVLPVDVVAEFAQPEGSLLVSEGADLTLGGDSLRLTQANSAISIRMQAHQVHSYAFTGASHERLLVAVRDITPCSSANMDPSSSIDQCNDESLGQLVPPVRFWSTNRYASPTGEPCSRHSVGSVAVADDSVFVCTRLSTGHDLTLGGISGWVRYYEWVDVANSFSSRLWANIPAGPSPLSTSLNAYPGDLWNSKSRIQAGSSLRRDSPIP